MSWNIITDSACDLMPGGYEGKGVGNDEGSIIIKGKAKGQEKAIRIMLYQMEECGFTGGHVVISHCHNLSSLTN